MLVRCCIDSHHFCLAIVYLHGHSFYFFDPVIKNVWNTSSSISITSSTCYRLCKLMWLMSLYVNAISKVWRVLKRTFRVIALSNSSFYLKLFYRHFHLCLVHWSISTPFRPHMQLQFSSFQIPNTVTSLANLLFLLSSNNTNAAWNCILCPKVSLFLF